MKTIILILSIFLGSLISEPLMASETSGLTLANIESSHDKNPFVDKTSSKRFKKSTRKVRRGKRTCLKKNGCSGKTRGLFKNRRIKISSFF